MLAAALPAEPLAIDLRGLQRLKAQAARADAGALRAAARQFEALLLQTLLREMREAHVTTAADAFADSDTIRLYRELLDQQWAQKIVQSGGLGFADALARQLERQQGGARAAGEVAQNDAARRRAGDALRAPTPRSEPAGQDSRSLPTTPAGEAGHSSMAATASTAPTAQDETQVRKAQFIQRLRPHAETAARQTGVPAAFILAHAALESGWGAREVRWADGRSTHNLFGIKAGAAWRGQSVESETLEYRQGLPLRVSERFRAYGDYAEAFADYAQLLHSRYTAAVQAGGDAQRFAQALAAGGYATDPAYAGKLQGVIASVARMLV